MDTFLRSKELETWNNVLQSEVSSVLIPAIQKHIEKPSIIVLEGELGAGKTSFVSAFLKQVVGVDNVNSPTYNLVSEYDGDNGRKIYHLDLYRLESEEELFDIGIEEILQSDYDYILVEWADLLIEQLNLFYHLSLSKQGNARAYQLHKVFVPLQG